MGKDLKGKQLGKGLAQEKSGYYLARFVDRFGKRQSKRFKKLQEAKQWLADNVYIDEHSNIAIPMNMTVDAFFDFWIDTKLKMTRIGTAEAYKVRYYKSVQPVIGNMKIVDVRVNHCQLIINSMIDNNYGNSTIKLTASVMRGIFDYAIECDIIVKNPCKITTKNDIGKPKKVKEALTKEEQKRFLKSIEGHVYENQFRFILQTGLRIGELMGLKWDDVDFKKKTIKVNRSMHYEVGKKTWRTGSPKSQAGRRTIPLTDEAIEILQCQKEKNSKLKVIPLEWREFIFLSSKGELLTSKAYNTALRRICKKEDIKIFTVHVLRHSFATRCIEAGMKPKTLQTIMGHSQIGVTMDLYVHTTEDELFNEIDLVANALKVI